MTRILLDECLPVKLKYRFEENYRDFQVSIVTSQGWTGIKNGNLLEKAQQEFDFLLRLTKIFPINRNFQYSQ